MELDKLLGRETMSIVEESMQSLKRADLGPYNESEPEENRQRFLALMELLIEGLQHKTILPMQEYGKTIAVQRYQKGYRLEEVFTAFSVLEENIWRHVINKVDQSRHSKYLGLVSTIFSRGKESFAIAYVDLVAEERTL